MYSPRTPNEVESTFDCFDSVPAEEPSPLENATNSAFGAFDNTPAEEQDSQADDFSADEFEEVPPKPSATGEVVLGACRVRSKVR